MQDHQEDTAIKIAREWGLVSEQDLQEAREAQERVLRVGVSRSLLDILIDRRALSETQLADIRREASGRGARPRIGRYELYERLGGGGGGSIYRARALGDRQTVVIKVLKLKHETDERYLEQFAREAEVVAKLDHPNIVRGYEGGWGTGYRYFVMEYARGDTLADVIKRRRRLSEKLVLHIARRMADALEHLEQSGVVHCDIKPGNIIIRFDGVIKLTDWGAVRLVNEAAGEGLDALSEEARAAFDKGKLVLATPNYMAPEMVKLGGRVDSRADFYSLGATMFCALVGHAPYRSKGAQEVVRRLLTEAPPSPRAALGSVASEVSEAMDALVQRLMAKDPADRPQTASELIEGIEKAKGA